MTTAYTPGAQVDHYHIIRMLGQGGMNRVYLARDVSNQQEVVLKFPDDALIGNIAVFERYWREAEIGNRLHHPYVQHLLNTDEKRSLVSQDPPSILLRNPQVSPALATVVMRAIRRDHEKRYRSMSNFLHDLRNLEEVKPVHYEPEAPRLNRTGRTAITATLLIIVIFLLIIALGFLAQFAHSAGH
jgi:serine/threonine protein kinase